MHQSLSCPSFFLQPVARHTGNSYQPGLGPVGGAVCPETGAKFKVGGPIWSEPIHDASWVEEALARVEQRLNPNIDTQARLPGLLTAVSEELPDCPLYYTLPDLCQTLHCTSPKMCDIQAAITNAGFRVSVQHKEPTAIKTNAPNDVIWDIFRCWVRKHPVSAKRGETSPGQIILSKEPSFEANFDGAHRFRSKAKKPATRFPHNPEPYWGPMSRARGKRPRDEVPADAASAPLPRTEGE